MNLLAPGFLYALVALAIPVIIHLFQFRKVRRVYFSNTNFLQQVKQVSQTKRRIKHLLILFCRLAFLLFLILTFARPYIPGSHQGKAQRVDIYLDNSYSMTNEVAEGVSAFDAAVNYTNTIIAAYPKGTRFRLITNGFEAAEQYYYNADVVTDKLTELSFSGQGRTVDEVLERLAIQEADEAGNERDVFLLSDMQRSAWTGDLGTLKSDSANRYFVVPFAYNTNKNIFIDSVYLDKPYYLPNLQNSLMVRLVNTGTSTGEVPVKFTVNGRQVATSTASVPANGKEQLSFPLNFSLDKLNEARLELIDYPVTFDNEFNLVLRKGDPIHVLEIKEEDIPSPVTRVYGDSALFRLRSRLVGNFNFSEMGWADLVVVNAIQTPTSALLTALQEYQAAGGSILYIPHPQTKADAIEQLAGRLAIQATPAAASIRLTKPNAQDPFFEGVFEEENASFTTPQAQPVISWAGRAENILNLQTGAPFAGQSDRLWLFASPLTDAFTNFHRHALFVPVMYKIAFSSKNVSNPLYFTTQQTVFDVQVAEQQQDRVYKLQREEEEIIPAQYRTDRTLLLDVPSYTLQPGFYNLLAGNSQAELLAFNHAMNESISDQLSSEDLQASVNNLSHIEILNDAAQTGAREMEANFGAVMLWKWTLLLALLFLLCEVLLIRFWK